MVKPGEFNRPVALTIAGFDPSGGAGVLADARTIAAFNCFPTAVITSITFQNNERVFGCVHQDADTVRAQITPILLELPIACVKTGMLPTREIVVEVAEIIREHKLHTLVVDPVMKSTSGYHLLEDDAATALKEELLPAARVVTPNIPEAEALTGFSIRDESDMRRAADSLRRMGAQAVLLKGGHLQGASEAMDLLDDGGHVTLFRSEWIEGVDLHGSGCLLSAALAACLARGDTLKDSVQQAKDFVAAAMRGARTENEEHIRKLASKTSRR
jgi:hydroxymethylpyrimidine kinase/phosphomethylpyrimidine kinase